MKTVKILLCVLAFLTIANFIYVWNVAIHTTFKKPEPFHICAMCETKIDTVGDKALRQWLDTDIRIEFKKWLILKERKRNGR